MTDSLGKLLHGILTAQPLCRECDAPAYFRFNGSPLCVEHFNSVIASGKASSGDEVAAGVAQPPAVAPAVTDPFESCGGVESRHARPMARCGKGLNHTSIGEQETDLAGVASGPQDFSFSKNATAFRVAANSGIQVSASSSDISAQHNQ